MAATLSRAGCAPAGSAADRRGAGAARAPPANAATSLRNCRRVVPVASKAFRISGVFLSCTLKCPSFSESEIQVAAGHVSDLQIAQVFADYCNGAALEIVSCEPA